MELFAIQGTDLVHSWVDCSWVLGSNWASVLVQNHCPVHRQLLGLATLSEQSRRPRLDFEQVAWEKYTVPVEYTLGMEFVECSLDRGQEV